MKLFYFLIRFCSFLFFFLNLSHAFSFVSTESDFNDTQVEKDLENEALMLYQDAKKKFFSEDYYLALEDIDRISNEYYYTKYYNMSIQMKAFILFSQERYDELDSFVDYYVDTNVYDYKNNSYLRYLQMYSNFKRIKRYNTHRQYIINTMNYISLIEDRYPESIYMENVKLLKKKIRIMFFYADLDIAYTYQKSRNYISAIRRYYKILEKYQDIMRENNDYKKSIKNNIAFSFQKIGINVDNI